MAKISGFIIAKNEEAMIERSLKSLVSFCDEIILVDSGSTDRTKEIALEYTDKIFDFEWVNDFSAARNFALSKCSGDWVVYIDADDEIDPLNQAAIKELIESSAEKTAGFFVSYRYAEDKSQLVPRIFKNGLGLKFMMPIHEYLDIPEKLKKSFVSHREIVIKHHKEVSENAVSLERNVAILEKNLKLDPENFHLKFFLGRELFNQNKLQEAEKIFQQLLNDKKITDRSFRYNILLHLGFCAEKNKEFQQACSYYDQAHMQDARFREPLIYAANIMLYQLRNVADAKKLYEDAVQIVEPSTTFPLNPKFYSGYPEEQLRKIEQLNKPMALVCGYYGMGNIGDELMLKSIVQNLSDYRIVVASYNSQMTKDLHQVEVVLHHDPMFDRALEQAEIVVIGGGTLFHDQGLKANKNVEYYCGIIQKAAALKKKVFLLGIGIDPLQLELNKKLVAETFPDCGHIYVRDENSQKLLTGLGLSGKNISVIPDLMFGLPWKPEKLKQPKIRIGINLCPSIQNVQPEYFKMIQEELIPWIQEKTGCEFIFIPGKADDLKMLELLQKNSGKEILKWEPDSDGYFESYTSIINSCDIVIAARYHLVLLALALQKPTYVVSYSPKTDALLETFKNALRPFKGNLDNIGSFEKINTEALLNELLQVFKCIK